MTLLLALASCGLHASAAKASASGSSRSAVPSPQTSTPPASTTPGPTLAVVGLGDSVMAGTHCDCDGMVKEYADALAARTGRKVTSTNLGVNGAVTTDLVEDMAENASQKRAVEHADVVLVTIGANDLLPQLDKWQSSNCPASCYQPAVATMGQHLDDLLATIDHLRSATGHNPASVLVTNYWNVFTDGKVARQSGGQAQIDWSDDVTSAANTAICRAAAKAQNTCVDLVAPFKGSMSGADHTDPTPLLASDGDHPNAAGVAAIVKALMAATPSL